MHREAAEIGKILGNEQCPTSRGNGGDEGIQKRSPRIAKRVSSLSQQ